MVKILEFAPVAVSVPVCGLVDVRVRVSENVVLV